MVGLKHAERGSAAWMGRARSRLRGGATRGCAGRRGGAQTGGASFGA